MDQNSLVPDCDVKTQTRVYFTVTIYIPQLYRRNVQSADPTI